MDALGWHAPFFLFLSEGEGKQWEELGGVEGGREGKTMVRM